jgi:hypothetical protein
LTQINWYVGDPQTPTVRYAPSSYTGQLAAAEQVLAATTVLYENETDAAKKAALKLKVTAATTQRDQVVAQRLRAQLLPSEIQAKMREIADPANAAIVDRLEKELTAKLQEQKQLEGTDQGAYQSGIDSGCE